MEERVRKYFKELFIIIDNQGFITCVNQMKYNLLPSDNCDF
ncbi:hypothetical protein M123_4480 [Bacteroides fragilis str. 3976T8]|uniref:Uncharacterized protein n=1 Tax=Bacteroides fragilis str. 3976T8 TaxID=1339314 RepID=A0A016BR50_BACFG|nr:hypothetical protein M123_4480 [Bacteroides fragilis str. 3976T8]